MFQKGGFSERAVGILGITSLVSASVSPDFVGAVEILYYYTASQYYTYVDAAYCYRPSSVVCRFVTLVSPAKTAEPIEMPFGLRTRVGPGSHVLHGVEIPHGTGQF